MIGSFNMCLGLLVLLSSSRFLLFLLSFGSTLLLLLFAGLHVQYENQRLVRLTNFRAQIHLVVGNAHTDLRPRMSSEQTTHWSRVTYLFFKLLCF